MQQDNLVYFAHGKESGPWGTKIKIMADLAKEQGFAVESPDYSGIEDPDIRVKQLLALKPSAKNKLVLVGSSMGAYVSIAASEIIKPDGLFLLAPAVLIPGFGRQDIKAFAKHVSIVHGWQDELIPVDNVVRFASQSSADLHLLDSDHRLVSVMNQIEVLFETFLKTILR